MKVADNAMPEVVSVLADLREVSLSEMPGNVPLSSALGRLFPESPVGQVPVAAFNSAI